MLDSIVDHFLNNSKDGSFDLAIMARNIAAGVAGFDVDEVMRNYETRGSLGMINLRERTESLGGEFTMESKIGEGTRTSVFVPNEDLEKEKRIKKRITTGMLTPPANMPPLKGESEQN